jgi:hypothetical protein
MSSVNRTFSESARNHYVRTTQCSVDLSKVMMVEQSPAQVLVYLLGGQTMVLTDPADVALFRDVLRTAKTTPPGDDLSLM